MLDHIKTGKPPFLKGARVDAIAEYLGPRLRPEDTVQPLDWTGGAAHALLICRARLATRFPYDVVFYHHVSTEYISNLRTQFLEQLSQSSPRFVVEVFSEDKPWIKGEDTTRSFDELRRFLHEKYIVVNEGNGYLIYESQTNTAVD